VCGTLALGKPCVNDTDCQTGACTNYLCAPAPQ
jgi:hypothetical protein